MFLRTPTPPVLVEQHTEFISHRAALAAASRLALVRCMAGERVLQVGPGPYSMLFRHVLTFDLRVDGPHLYLNLTPVDAKQLKMLRDISEHALLARTRSRLTRWRLRSEWWLYPTSLWVKELEREGWAVVRALVQNVSEVGPITLEPVEP